MGNNYIRQALDETHLPKSVSRLLNEACLQIFHLNLYLILQNIAFYSITFYVRSLREIFAIFQRIYL